METFMFKIYFMFVSWTKGGFGVIYFSVSVYAHIVGYQVFSDELELP